MSTKKCNACQELKSLDEFYSCSGSKDGKQYKCKICINSINKINRDKNKANKPIAPTPLLSDILKTCRACSETKSIDLYYKDSKQTDGLFKKCKTCVDNKIKIPKISIIEGGVKRCSQCQEIKNLDGFYTSKKESCGYRSECIKCKLEIGRQKENKSEYKQNYRKATRDYTNQYNKKYYAENKERVNKQSVEWNKKNYHRRKLKHLHNLQDPVYNAQHKIRGTIASALVSNNVKKSKKTFDILGCSKEFFKEYIESQFLPWMNWGNGGRNTGEYDKTWQLDHIIAACNAKTEGEVYLLNHWSNFQPLCSKKNNEKLCTVYPVSNIEICISIETSKNLIKI